MDTFDLDQGIPVYCSDGFHSSNSQIVSFIVNGNSLLITYVNGLVELYSLFENASHPELKGSNSALPVECPKWKIRKVRLMYKKLPLLKKSIGYLIVAYDKGIGIWTTAPLQLILYQSLPIIVRNMSVLDNRIFITSQKVIHSYSVDLEGTTPSITWIAKYQVHTKEINYMTVNQQLILTASDDELIIWRVKEGSELNYRGWSKGSEEVGTLVALTSKENFIMIAYSSGLIEILSIVDDIFNGGNLVPYSTIRLNHHGKPRVMMCNNVNLFIGFETGIVQLVDLEKLVEAKGWYIQAHNAGISTFIVSHNTLFTGDFEGNIKIWASRKPLSNVSTSPREILGDAVVEVVDKVRIKINPEIREIGKSGTVIAKGKALSLMTSGKTGEYLKSIGILENADHKMAERVLQLMRSFVPCQDVYSPGQNPTHKWNSKASLSELRTLVLPLIIAATKALKKDHMLVKINSPAYVLGDLHGSYKDLQLFSNLWKLGVDFTPSNYVFLGDYVDRGPHSVEVIIKLLCLKVLYPTQVYLLRGNHEFRSQNGKTYSPSFQSQCINFMFNEEVEMDENLIIEMGVELWEKFNSSFDWMPLAATIDGSIFCCHGGVPRAIYRCEDLLSAINSIDRPLKDADVITSYEFLALDLLWADVASSEKESSVKSEDGFLPSERGPDLRSFGTIALEKFLAMTNTQLIIRAHQPPQLGVQIDKQCKVLTVFSSSHYCGRFNSAAVVFVNKDIVQIAISSHRTVDSPDSVQIEKHDLINSTPRKRFKSMNDKI